MAMAMATVKHPIVHRKLEATLEDSPRSTVNWPRLILVSILGVVLASLLAAQALSSFATTKDPQLAVSVFPANGLARGALAFQGATQALGGTGEIPVPTPASKAEAASALRSDPLSTKAHIVLALSQADDADRKNVLSAANSLNRRDLALQGLVLNEAVAEEDYDATIATLDRMLRVHPDYTAELFPFLVEALRDERTIGTFARLLDASSPWHLEFLDYASRQDFVAVNLSKLRPAIEFQDVKEDDRRLEEFDRRLIAKLASIGEFDRATELYESISGSSSLATAGLANGWRSEYPPFDWYFVDEPGFRAQSTAAGDALEVAIRPGKGGIFAGRLFRTLQAPFSIEFDFTLSPSDRARDLRLQLTCRGSAAAFFDEAFEEGKTRFMIPRTPADCEYLGLALSGRAWSGRSKLDIEIRSITIEPR